MNKRTKAILYAALSFVGLIGATASVEANRQSSMFYFYHLEGDDFILLDPTDQGEPGGWDCLSGSQICNYTKIDPNGETVPSNMTVNLHGTFTYL